MTKNMTIGLVILLIGFVPVNQPERKLPPILKMENSSFNSGKSPEKI